jgi:hypothetical protein
MKGDNGTNNFNTTRVRCGGKKKNQSIENDGEKRQLIATENFERLCVVNGKEVTNMMAKKR